MALNNVPLSGQSLAVTRVPINQNFSVIDTAFSVNHVPYNDPSSNQGKHNVVEMPVISGAVPAVAGEFSLYNQLSANTSLNELFIKRGIGNPYEITANGTGSVTGASSGTYRWTKLPSGLLIYFNDTNNYLTANGNSSFTFNNTAGNPPTFSAIYTAAITTTSTAISDSNTFARLMNFAVNPGPGVNLTLLVWGSPRTTTGSAAASFSYIIIGLGQ